MEKLDYTLSKTMATVTIPERILMKEGVKTARFTLIFVGNGYHNTTLKNTVGLGPTALHKKIQ